MWFLDVFIQLYCLNLNYVEHIVTVEDYEIIVLSRMLGTCYRMQTHCCLTLIKSQLRNTVFKRISGEPRILSNETQPQNQT